MNTFTPKQMHCPSAPRFRMSKVAAAALAMAAALGASSASAQIPILNSGFESPQLSNYSASGNITIEDIVSLYGGSIENWEYFNEAGALAGSPSGLSTLQSQSGNQSLWFSSSSSGPHGGGGYYQGYSQVVNNEFMTGQDYVLGAYFKSDAISVFSGHTFASLKMEFFTGADGSGTSVGSYEILVTPDTVSTDWQQFTVNGSVSMAASSVKIVISIVNPPADYTDSSGTLYIDNVNLAQIPEPATVGYLVVALAVCVGLCYRRKAVR